MIKPLRKRHLQIWTLLAIVIPAGIISAYMAVPKEALDKLLQEDKTVALPVEIKKVERKDCTAFLRSNNERNKYQLQVNIIDEATTPSSLIYQITKGEKELIGRLATKGNYYFSLKADSTSTYNFILYDIIHQQTIDTLKF
jgi:L-2-hydroxyglutarate oxidase LhgO